MPSTWLTIKETSLCSASYVSRQHGTARMCCCIHCCSAVAAGCAAPTARPPPATVDQHLLPGGGTASNSPHIAAVVDRWDRQTNRRMDSVPLHRPCSAYYVNSANNNSGLSHFNNACWDHAIMTIRDCKSTAPCYDCHTHNTHTNRM